MTRRALLALGVLAQMLPGAARGQTAAEHLASGIQAYQNLELDEAAGLLRRASRPDAGLAPDALARALVYLGATEIYRGESDSARAAFARLIRLDPRYRIDALVFPPEVTGTFEGVRRSVHVVAFRVPETVAFRAGQPGLVMDLFPSSFHDVRVEILRGDGSAARSLYVGPVGDSLRVEWDGRAVGGAPLPSGRYVLAISSLDDAGAPSRIVRIPLSIALTLGDTTPHPPPPADSVLLPERATPGPALEALIGGAVVGLAVGALPSVFASDAELSPARLVVGVAVGVTGVSAFLARRPGRPLPGNIAENDRTRAAWRAELDRVTQLNEALKRAALVRATLGDSQVIERGPR